MVLSNLRDEHTITTYDFDQAPDGTLYIAMELLEGKSLGSVFEAEAPLAWRRVFEIMEQMCTSLGEAHGQGIVHRDLKPDNIYLESRPGKPEFVKFLDFGIAKVRSGDTIQTPQLTATGDTLGTLEYMSPEQLRGKELDGRSDIYALGVLGFEMMCGRLPFPNKDSPVALMMSQLKETPPAPSSVVAGIDPLCDAVIAKCLEKEKDKRFDDVAKLAAAIRHALDNAGKVPAFVPPTPPPPGPAPVVAEPAPPVVAPIVAEPPKPIIAPDSRFDIPAQPPKKSNALVILIALIAIGVVVTGVVIALR
jgi:serine/threonine-protein kinase